MWPLNHGTIRVKCLAQGHKKCHKDFGTSWTRTHARSHSCIQSLMLYPLRHASLLWWQVPGNHSAWSHRCHQNVSSNDSKPQVIILFCFLFWISPVVHCWHLFSYNKFATLTHILEYIPSTVLRGMGSNEKDNTTESISGLVYNTWI